MKALPSRVGIPISKIRLTGAAITGVGFGLMLYLASANQSWIAISAYLLYAVITGAVLGRYEAKLVLSQINRNTMIFRWQLTAATVGLIVVPFAAVNFFYGFPEGRDFLIYVGLTTIPVFLAVSGFEYTKFEKHNNVLIYSSPYGFWYWIEQPVRDYSEKFYYFLRDIETKDAASMWQHAGYQRIYLKELEKNQELTIETKKSIRKILKTFRIYRIVSLTILGIIVIGWPLLMLFSFTSGFGLLHMPLNAIMNIIMPILGGSFIAICISVFVLTRSLKSKMTKALPQIKIERKYG